MPGEKEQEYDVKDRRAFNPDGTPRERVDEKPEEPPIIIQDAAAQSAAGQSHEHALPPVDFLTFVYPLIAEAFACMGVGQKPSEGGPKIELPIAKHLIDTVGMLQEKTKGNLTPDEARHLSDALRDLRMQYVSLLNARSA